MVAVVKPYMNTSDILRNSVSRSVFSVALITCSALWFAGACEYYATSGFRVDWSATPLFWMVAVVITPPICFSGCMILVDLRKRLQLSPIEWWALATAFLPVTLGTLLSVWAIKVLLSMSGV